MTSFQTLRTDVSHRVATIWLNRPERRNAFSSVMTRELYEAFALFESAEDVRAIVVTGRTVLFRRRGPRARRPDFQQAR